VYIDADGRFSARRLAQILERHIKSSSPEQATPTDEQVQTAITEALNHIYVFRPHSSSQLLSTVLGLSEFLLDGHRHQSIHRPLGLIVLDGATAFYWQDRFDSVAARLEAPHLRYDSEAPSTTAQIIAGFKTLQQRFECAVAFSTVYPSSPPQQPKSGAPAASGPNESAISPWTNYAVLTMSLSRVAIPQFASPMDMDACLRDREKRLEAVKKGKFVASVVGKIKGRTEAVNTGGSLLAFRITTDGVEIE
jgi:hypothetical protein